MDTKKLRQKVLDLAIHGKLVKQDPNDEPANILLDRIRAEKARLVKEGKIKKSELKYSTISAEEILFDLPKGWSWVRLGELVTMFAANKSLQTSRNRCSRRSQGLCAPAAWQTPQCFS